MDPPYANGFSSDTPGAKPVTVEMLRQLNLPALCPIGFIFIWVDKPVLSDVVYLMEECVPCPRVVVKVRGRAASFRLCLKCREFRGALCKSFNAQHARCSTAVRVALLCDAPKARPIPRLSPPSHASRASPTPCPQVEVRVRGEPHLAAADPRQPFPNPRVAQVRAGDRPVEFKVPIETLLNSLLNLNGFLLKQPF